MPKVSKVPKMPKIDEFYRFKFNKRQSSSHCRRLDRPVIALNRLRVVVTKRAEHKPLNPLEF